VRCRFNYKICVVGALILTFCLGGANALAKDRKEAKTFTIKTDVASVSPGDNGAVKINFMPAKGYKWNDEFPATVRVDGMKKNTHIRLEKSSFATKDFKIKEGLKGAGIKIPFKAVSKGRQTITAKARFSVCNDTACVVKNESIEITVSVK